MTALALVPSALAAEPNDNSTTADPLSEGVNGPFDISPAGDVDWYWFTVANTSQVTVETGGASGDTVMYLYDANATAINYNDDGGAGLFSKITQICSPGLYYASVEEFSGVSTISNYTVTLTIVDALGADGNGLMANATPIAVGDNGPYDIDPAGDLDWYTVTFSGASMATFEITGATGATEMILYDQYAYYPLDTDYDSGTGDLSWIAYQVSAAQYYILVEGASPASQIFGYHLVITTGSVPVDANDDDCANATSVTIPSTTSPASLTGQYDVDMYTVTTTEQGTIFAETNGAYAGASVSLWDMAMNNIAYGTDSGNGSFKKLSGVVDIGTYCIAVGNNYGVSNVLSYTLTVTFTPWVNIDGNDFKSQAVRLVPGLNGPFVISPVADSDWFWFDQSENGTATVDAIGSSDTTLDMQNATGALLDGGVYGYTQVSDNHTAGRYYVRARSAFSSYIVPRYWLNLTVPDTTPPVVAVDNVAAGSTVESGALTVSGTVEPGSSVTVDGVPVTPNADGHFTAVVAIVGGANTITILATDAAGHSSTTTISVTGHDSVADLQAQLTAKNATLATAQADLNTSQAQVTAKTAALTTAQSQAATQNATMAAANADLAAARGSATMMMALAAVGLIAAVLVAVMMMRKKPPMPSAGAPPSTPPPTQ